ncbi:Copper-exporting P-type ATPase A [termite gut metagenome]|uniref:Copper-exporting P-type ATPase A n=1 Tax=termite gut metagenome TaxID=433724 RepID=A0A5J4PHE6_9ZZZZ
MIWILNTSLLMLQINFSYQYGNTIKRTFPVLKMHCAGCANNIERTVKKLQGVTDASVNFVSGILSVTYDPGKLSLEEIRKAVVAAGYDLISIEEGSQEEWQTKEQRNQYRQLKRKVIGTWIVALPVLVFSMFFPNILNNGFLLILSLSVFVFFGNSFYINAWKQAKLGRCFWRVLLSTFPLIQRQ